MRVEDKSTKDTGKYGSTQERKQARKIAGNLEENYRSDLIDAWLCVVAKAHIQLLQKKKKGQEKL